MHMHGRYGPFGRIPSNSIPISPSAFLVPQSWPPCTFSYPALSVPTRPFQSPKSMGISKDGIFAIIRRSSSDKWSFLCHWGQTEEHKDIVRWKCPCEFEGIPPKGPTRHANAWQVGPFWLDTLELPVSEVWSKQRCELHRLHLLPNVQH